MIERTNNAQPGQERRAALFSDCCIYKIILVSDGRCYIGSAVCFRTRKNRHLHNLRKGNHHSIVLQRAYDKHGEAAFEFQIVEQCNRDMLIEREQFWIDALSPAFNMERIAGSSLGRKHSEETKLKMAVIASRVQKGRKHSEESKRKRSLALKGRKPHPSTIAATIAACKGRTLTAEHRNKISQGVRRSLTDEIRAKLSVTSTGRKQTPEAIARRITAYKDTCRLRNLKFIPLPP